MILPDGKNKKYAEVVSGLYILYVILNPILNIDKNVSIQQLPEFQAVVMFHKMILPKVIF